MKKSLLLLSAAALSAGAVMAQPQSTVTFGKYPGPVAAAPAKAPAKAAGDATLTYSKAESLASFYYTQAPATKFYVYLMTEMSVADQQPFIGCSIKTVNVTAGAKYGSNFFPVSSVDAYVSDEMNAIPQAVTTSEINIRQGVQTKVTLDTPVEITGEKPIYFGYRMQVTQSQNAPVYYIPVDVVPTAADVNNTLVAYVTDLSQAPQFVNLSSQEVGSLCVSMDIEGALKDNQMALRSLVPPAFAKTGPLTYTVKLANVGANPISSFDIKTVINGGEPVEQTVTLSAPVASGANGTADVTVDNNLEGAGLPLVATVTAVNGVALESPLTASCAITSFNEAYARRAVMEEGTGTWCGYCPAGVDMMETLKEKYPDWIRIAVHSGDFLATSTYSRWLNDYVDGFPQAVVNRAEIIYPTALTDADYPELDRQFAKDPTYLKVDLEAEGVEMDQEVNVTATVTFACPVDGKHLLSFVVVEDNVKAPITDNMPEKTKQGFMQHNYYSKEFEQYAQVGYREGWSDLPEYVEMDFNDVARSLTSYPGISGSLPEKCDKGSYTYSTSLSIKNVTNDDYRIVALVTNSDTGEIINANEISMQKVAVKDIASEKENVDIRVVNGDVTVAGAQNVSVYTLDGRKVASTGLASGVYIICADGKTAKVLVK